MRLGQPLLEFVHRDPAADVLVVTNMWPEAARPVYGIFVQRQVASLQSAGVRCDVLYLRGYASVWAYPLAALSFALSSFRWRGCYRLIHVHAGETALAARFHVGTPIVVSYCGDDLLGDRRADGTTPLASRVRAAFLRAHARLFPATITKSTAMEDALPQSMRRRNSVIPNGVDTDLFRPIERAEARRRLGWDLDERIALFAATKPETPRKRLWLARAACSIAAERLPNLRIHVADGLDPVTMPDVMNAADCLLFTSALEGSPNTVKEALMCNLPIVATPAGDIKERLEGVRPSWICPPAPESLAAALVECLKEPTRSNGRRVAGGLSQDRVAQRITALYGELVSSAPPVARPEPRDAELLFTRKEHS